VHYESLLRDDRPNVLTIHAELEGMGRRGLFRDLLERLCGHDVEFVRMDALANELLANRASIPVCDQVMAAIDGRSGLVATQVA
jgi:hypothetical protein